MNRRWPLILTKGLQLVLLNMIAALAFSGPAEGQVRLVVPEESAGGPYYARVERGVVLEAHGWVAIAFYRDPACVRSNFNLLNFMDFANIPSIFSCSLTVNGFELWDDPATDAAPRQSKLRGNGSVPIWFVSDVDFRAALPGITLTELLAMPSLMQGVATQFEETLHPLGGAQQNSLQIAASGDLPDGRTFQFLAVEAAGELRHVEIAFR
jgi:hypothetical protein